MKYYMCTKDFDCIRKDKTAFTVFTGELFTEREMEKYSLPERFFVKINARKKDTYFCFGVRKLYRGTEVKVLGD